MKTLNNFFSKYGNIIFIVLALFYLRKGITDFLDKLFERNNNIGDFKDAVNVDYSYGINSIQANRYALQLLNAFNSKEPFYGTDEKVVEQIFKDLSSNDFKKIYKEFGQRDYNGYNSPPEGVFSGIDDYEKRDLVYWLRSEIHPTYDKNLYKIVQKVVKSSGFKF